MGARNGRNGPAAAGLGLGIAGLLTSPVLIGGVVAVAGLILGIAALTTAGRIGTGRGRAVAAVVTSSLAVLVSALAVVLLLWYANRTQECYRPDSLHQYAQCVRLHLDGN
ncbi:DUF4190 domain-containing protein [Streptomyces sp. AC1-42W]|nr:DUF4190 domain-containing protein [Streptomyces sp. AC1-42T]PZT73306.1 DUF4190 domain-containing protein [Streptomyces sp. AC1-42W]